MGKYHTPGVDPPKVHYESEGERPLDLAETVLHEQNADLHRFRATAHAFIDELEKRHAIQDQLAQEHNPARITELSQDLRTAERNTELLRTRLDDHAVDLAEQFQQGPDQRPPDHSQTQAHPPLDQASFREADAELRQHIQQEQASIDHDIDR